MRKKDVNFEPFLDFVLCTEIEYGFSAGGVALPVGADMGPKKGRVVKVGPGRWEHGTFIETMVAPGTIVFVESPYNDPREITLDGQNYMLVRERDLVGSVEEE